MDGEDEVEEEKKKEKGKGVGQNFGNRRGTSGGEAEVKGLYEWGEKEGRLKERSKRRMVSFEEKVQNSSFKGK